MSDMLPLLPTKGTSTAPSVTFSLAVEARSVERDIQFDDEMDETFCGDTTIEGGGENAWEDDNTFDDLETAQSRTRLPELAGEKNQRGTQNDGEKVEVWLDHTPQLNNALPEQGDASLVVLAPSAASTYRTADDSENDDDTITREDHQTYGKGFQDLLFLAVPISKTNSQYSITLLSSLLVASTLSSSFFRESCKPYSQVSTDSFCLQQLYGCWSFQRGLPVRDGKGRRNGWHLLWWICRRF